MHGETACCPLACREIKRRKYTVLRNQKIVLKTLTQMNTLQNITESWAHVTAFAEAAILGSRERSEKEGAQRVTHIAATVETKCILHKLCIS